MTKQETLESYHKHIAPKYPNGTGNHIPCLIKMYHSPRKFSYGIRFEISPVVGEFRISDGDKFRIEEILA